MKKEIVLLVIALFLSLLLFSCQEKIPAAQEGTEQLAAEKVADAFPGPEKGSREISPSNSSPEQSKLGGTSVPEPENSKNHKTDQANRKKSPSLAEAKRGLRTRGIDCSFENDHTTKQSLAIDPVNINVLYVGIEGKGIYKSSDGGVTWSKKSNGLIAYPDQTNLDQLCPPDPNKIVIDPTNPQRLLLSPGDISTSYVDWPYGETGGVWESLDGAESWQQILKENLNAAGTSLAIDPHNPQTIYYGVNSDPATFKEAPIKESLNQRGVLYRTTDGGRSWEEMNTGMLPGLQASGIFVDPQDPPHLVLFTQAHHHIYGENYIQEIFSYEQFGPMISHDGGKSWKKLAENLPIPFRNPFEGDVAPSNFNHMIVRPFLFGEEFPSDVQQKSFYSLDGGNSFGETAAYINVGRYDPHDPEGNHLLGYAPWYANGDIVESFDGGKSWTPIGSGEPPEIDNTKIKVTNFVWNPQHKEVVYMSGTQGYVWKSIDGGKGWKVVLSLEMLRE